MIDAEKLALVGAGGMVGSAIKTKLVAAGYPGSSIELFDLQEQVGLLTEYGEEARIVLEAAEDSMHEHVLACFCGDPDTARRFVPIVVESGGLAIDCTGAYGNDPMARLATATNVEAVAAEPGIVAIAHPATSLLAELHGALGEHLRDSVATILLPASATSEAGLEELAAQASGFLNLDDVETGILGRQLAFDTYLDARPVDSSAVVRAQLAQLGSAVPAISAVQVSVFHGLAAAIRLQAPAGTVREALAAGGIVVESINEQGAAIDSPVRATGQARVNVASIRDDGAGGSWLWALIDNFESTASVAVAVIAARLRPPAEASVS